MYGLRGNARQTQCDKNEHFARNVWPWCSRLTTRRNPIRFHAEVVLSFLSIAWDRLGQFDHADCRL